MHFEGAETGPDSMSGEIEVSEVPNSEDESPGTFTLG